MRTREDVLDELLVLRIQGGDRASLEALARRWQPKLVRHAVHLTGELDGASDVAQDAWLAIVRGLRRLRDPSRFRAWAYRIVTRKASDWIRSRVRRRRLNDHVAESPVLARASEMPSDRATHLREQIAKLPEDRRALLSMYYTEGMTIGEISEVLSIPRGTVKSRLFHVRNQLRTSLEEAS